MRDEFLADSTGAATREKRRGEKRSEDLSTDNEDHDGNGDEDEDEQAKEAA